MPEVIPAILAKTYQEVEEKIRKVEPYVRWVQIDVVDGIFAPNITWSNPEELDASKFSVNIEADLMIAEPEKYIAEWISAGVKRILVHIEALDNKEKITELSIKTRQAEVEFGLSLNPETQIERVIPFISLVNAVLLLGVRPGFGGQRFEDKVLDKIAVLRSKFPALLIEVDGGINLDTGKKCVEAGADVLVAGSYIFGSGNVKMAIEELRKTVS